MWRSNVKAILVLVLLSLLPSSVVLAATGVVNTPGDGFLALRSEPSTSTGVRLAKIPHASPLSLGDCVATAKTERWCRTTYKGQSGWVLERYLSKRAGERNDASTSPAVTPAKGDAVRKAILDAIRAKYPRPVVFVVHHLKVSGDWAWATVTAAASGDPTDAYESESALVRKERGEWTVVGGLDHSGECAVDPICFEREFTKLRNEFPEAPSLIFE